MGYTIGIIAGCFTFMNQVPYNWWVKDRKADIHSPYVFILSQSLGILLVNIAIFGVLRVLQNFKVGFFGEKFFCSEEQAPFWIAALPGFIWVFAFACSLEGNEKLGMSVGYVLTAIGPVVITGILSAVLFNEVVGVRQNIIFWTAISMMVVCTVILAVEDFKIRAKKHMQI